MVNPAKSDPASVSAFSIGTPLNTVTREHDIIDTLVQELPKAELHLHIEGTFEPELIFRIAERNRLKVPYPSVDALRQAYQFHNLKSFLDVYYQGMNVLKTEEDFYDLANAYFAKAKSQNVTHAELFFDPQAHTGRGLPFRVVIDGLWQAIKESKERFGITSNLIMCFLRDQPPKSAMQTIDQALPFGERIVAVGLDSAERNNPPSKFQAVFDRARAEGWRTVAHAGEEGPPEYVWEAINLLKVSRVDHGVRSLEDAKLTRHLVDTALPLTVCPLSNIKLKVFACLEDHNLKKMLELGIKATVNSDDPAYFGGYVGDNYKAAAEALKLSAAELITLARNSFTASFISEAERASYLARIDEVERAFSQKAPENECCPTTHSP
ncbi:MAG TPA: adenosine deaminase [Candidatus Obscuribacterales bacterium]